MAYQIMHKAKVVMCDETGDMGIMTADGKVHHMGAGGSEVLDSNGKLLNSVLPEGYPYVKKTNTIEFDGTITDVRTNEKAITGVTVQCCLIANEAPTQEELAQGGIISMMTTDGVQTADFEVTAEDEKLTVLNGSVYVVQEDNYTYGNALTFPVKGIYMAAFKADGTEEWETYAVTLTFNGHEFTKTVPISEEFLPKSGVGDKVLGENGKLLNSVLPNALQFGDVPEYLSIVTANIRVYNLGEEQTASVPTTNNIPANTEIIVVWDGVEYVRMSTETDDKIEVGDYDADPFYMCKYKNQTLTDVYSRDAGYHDFSVGYYITVIKKIDDNFIPINIARKDDLPNWDSLENKPFYEGYEDVVMFSGNYNASEFTGTNFTPVVYGNLPIKEDTTYKVIWDGVEYIRTSVMYKDKPVIGDYDSDPFFMINNGVSICLFSRNPGKHDVTVSYETYVMKQLDQKFIPKATAVADATTDTVTTQFNALLSALRDAGYLAT